MANKPHVAVEGKYEGEGLGVAKFMYDGLWNAVSLPKLEYMWEQCQQVGLDKRPEFQRAYSYAKDAFEKADAWVAEHRPSVITEGDMNDGA